MYSSFFIRKIIKNKHKVNNSIPNQSLSIYNTQQSFANDQSCSNLPSMYIVTNEVENHLYNQKNQTLNLIDFDLNTKKLDNLIQKDLSEKVKGVMIKYFESRSNFFCGETQIMNIHSFRELIEALLSLKNLLHLYLANITSTNDVERTRQGQSLRDFLSEVPHLKTLDICFLK